LVRFLFLRQTQEEFLQDFWLGFEVIGLDGIYWVFIIHFSSGLKKERKELWFRSSSILAKTLPSFSMGFGWRGTGTEREMLLRKIKAKK